MLLSLLLSLLLPLLLLSVVAVSIAVAVAVAVASVVAVAIAVAVEVQLFPSHHVVAVVAVAVASCFHLMMKEASSAKLWKSQEDLQSSQKDDLVDLGGLADLVLVGAYILLFGVG